MVVHLGVRPAGLSAHLLLVPPFVVFLHVLELVLEKLLEAINLGPQLLPESFDNVCREIRMVLLKVRAAWWHYLKK